MQVATRATYLCTFITDRTVGLIASLCFSPRTDYEYDHEGHNGIAIFDIDFVHVIYAGASSWMLLCWIENQKKANHSHQFSFATCSQ